MDTVMDIFRSDAYGVVAMTDVVNAMPFVPGRAGALGIFEESGIATTVIAIERRDGLLALIPNQKRGTPNWQNQIPKGKLRTLELPHLRLTDAVQPHEVQNVRAFGAGAGELKTMDRTVQERLDWMIPKHDVTVEYGRIGALKGIILDADGTTVIANLFTEFGVTQTPIDFTLGTTTTDLIALSADVSGAVEDALGAAVYDHIHVFCGKTFWKKFISHTAVKDAYRYYEATGQNMNPLRDDLRYRGFAFGGLVWEQYRGKVGGVSFVADSEAHAFPVGVPGLFKTVYGPADWNETVNTIGIPRYAKQYPTDNRGSSITVETQSNPLSYCVRPEVLQKLTTSN